jgi:hypothetical protein
MIKDNWKVCLDQVFNDPFSGKKPTVLLNDICVFFRISVPRYTEYEKDKLKGCVGKIEFKSDKEYKETHTGKTRNEAKNGSAKKLILRFIYDAEYAFVARKYLIAFFKKIDNSELQKIIPKEEDVLSLSSVLELNEKVLSENEPPKIKETQAKPLITSDEKMRHLNFNAFCTQYERKYVPVGMYCVKLYKFIEATSELLTVRYFNFRI